MNYISVFLDWIECHIGFILTICGMLFAWYIYCKEVKCNKIRKLAEQVVAYYCLEQEAIKEIQSKTNESVKTIKIRLREKALRNENNGLNAYPSMTAKGAKREL